MPSLIGNRILSSTTPSLSGSPAKYTVSGLDITSLTGYQWQSESAPYGVHEWSGTSWKLILYPQQERGGLVPLTGTQMSGPLTGDALGLAKIDSASLTGSPTVNGSSIATQTYVMSQISALSQSISTQVAVAVSSAGSSSGVSTNIAKRRGYYQPVSDEPTTSIPVHKQIPLPRYSEGTPQSVEARESECVWIASMGEAQSAFFNSADSANQKFRYILSEDTPRVYNSYVQKIVSDTASYVPCGLHWFILGVRYSSV